ncbi:type II toxin-antitoxin system antitoxin SocA domain-containing protein [Barnesiella sp. An55]|uniref:type II toxin-antitoxin system antitoxin SocA domain-containing protein n=1 Tax=Barnesiella sp. An55 TaxID=1965646 RepID=UPI000B380963|nr:type II toxin-antitoxin system antitoxin SocA domain-containing protein [Barnesiella sp. An55]OUN68517.1 hypothetical protein B5G10_12300 [Barnesiella sp. An55]
MIGIVEKTQKKIKAFDYMLQLFEEWRDDHKTIKGKPLSKLTALKLLFLTAAPKKDKGDDLLDIFDNFYAMPYGPVESDVYNVIQANTLPSYVSEYKIIKRREGGEDNSSEYAGSEFENIRNAVNALRAENEKLIELNAFDLVAITHRWDSWNRAMDFAEFMGQLSAKMPKDSIRKDSNKRFSLTD